MACIAAVPIPQGTFSKPFRVHEIHASTLPESRGNVKISFPLQVGITTSGEMMPVSPVSNLFWPKLIDIASDCHDQNIKLCRWSNRDTLVLQATRDIPAGHKLQLWFSEDLMMSDLGIPPYLSPYNIKGGNSYVCHECSEEFERPNLLKLHLALHCDRLSLETIWNRLKSTGPSPLLVNPSYILNLSPSMNLARSPSSLFNVNIPSPKASNASILQLSPPSQFHPNQVHNHHGILPLPLPEPRLHNNNKGSTGLASSSTPSSSPSPVIVAEAPVEGPIIPADAPPESNGRSLVVQEQHHHHARLEAIVSNMGKAKNGHVCLYCGKLYSRKYGLKIHIRTHTGYKPLRCKICHRPFGDPSNLNKHVRLHSDGTTPYRCKLCSKVLVRRRDLDRHIRTRHHGAQCQVNARSNGNGNTTQQQSSSAGHSRTSTVTSSMVSSSRI